MIKRSNNYTIVEQPENILGEGLHICNTGIYWLDIIEKKFFVKLNKCNIQEFDLPAQASSIWKVENQLIYLASESGICTFDLKTNKWTVITSMSESDFSSSMRTNDGAGIDDECYFFGSMEKSPSGTNGALYIAMQQSISKVYDGIGIPNSFIRISELSFLVSDSLKGLIYCFTFNEQYTVIDKKELWLDLSESDFTPDGGCIDSHGNIYIAMWDGYCINKYDKSANLLSVLELPVPRPTNCKLSLDEKSLYVTSAREGLTMSDLKNSPNSGALFKIEL
jgi:sugar lactone lactonase YvrE